MKSVYSLLVPFLVVATLMGLMPALAQAQVGDQVAEATKLLEEQGYRVLSMEKGTIEKHPAGIVLMPMISQTDKQAIGKQLVYGLAALYLAYGETVDVDMDVLAYDQRYGFLFLAKPSDVAALLNEQLSGEEFVKRTVSFWYDFQEEQEVPGPGKQAGKGFGNKNFTQ
jgi:cytochrome bd-type quinol oxidase subunit 1